jgi:hypothetical protein
MQHSHSDALDNPNLGAHDKLALLERLRKRAQDAATRMENQNCSWSDDDEEEAEEDELLAALRFKARQQHLHTQPTIQQREPPPVSQYQTRSPIDSSSLRQRQPGPTNRQDSDSEDEAGDALLMRVEPSEWYDEESGERMQSEAERHDQLLLEQTTTAAQRQKERKRMQLLTKEWKDKLLVLANRGQAIEREVAALLRKPNRVTSAANNEHTLLERADKELQRKRADEKNALAHQTSRAKTAVALLKVHLDKPGSGDLYLTKAKDLAQGAHHVIDDTRDTFTGLYDKLK